MMMNDRSKFDRQFPQFKPIFITYNIVYNLNIDIL